MKSGNRPSQINHVGWHFLHTELTGGVVDREGSTIMAEELTGWWSSCLCPLMPSPISCMTESCDLSHRKSPDTCGRKLYFNTTPLKWLKMTLQFATITVYTFFILTVKGSNTIKVQIFTQINVSFCRLLKAVTFTAKKQPSLQVF